MRLLVVGAGPAGTRVAERAAARVPGAAVTLLGAEPALPYDRVALGRLLTRGAEVGDLLTHTVPALRALGVAYRAAARVARIERAERRVVLAGGEALAYDRLVLATGSTAVRLPLPGADLPGVVAYRTMADVRVMLRAAAEGGGAVVIGGGLLGLEAADGLAARGMAVTVVHPVGWPMERQVDATAGGLLARRLGGRGIRFAMPATTEAILGGERVEAVRLSDGRVLRATLVVMAVGVRPEVALAREAGLAVGRGIVVDDALRTADPAILAVGECAEHRGVVCGLVKPALAQAEVAAATLADAAAVYAPLADAAALKVSGTAVWSAGEIAAGDAEAVTLHDSGEDTYRRLLLRDGALVGAVLYGDTDDAPFYLDLISSRRTVGPAERATLALGPAFAPPTESQAA